MSEDLTQRNGCPITCWCHTLYKMYMLWIMCTGYCTGLLWVGVM